MKILVLGATGLVGGHVVRTALGRGHQVTAYVRQPDAIVETGGAPIGYARGDATDAETLAAAAAGHDAVVSAVGGPTDLRRRVAATLIEALPLAGLRRVSLVGGAGILQLGEDPERLMLDAPGFPRALLAVSADHRAAWRALEDSDLAWTMVCPPLIRDEAASGKAIAIDDRFPPGGHQDVAAGDVALLLLTAVEAGRHLRCRVGIARGEG